MHYIIVAVDHGHLDAYIYTRESIHKPLAENCAAIDLSVELFNYVMSESTGVNAKSTRQLKTTKTSGFYWFKPGVYLF